MTARELITLQVGHHANFVGAHWWNAQEAQFSYTPTEDTALQQPVFHDAVFRVGENARVGGT